MGFISTLAVDCHSTNGSRRPGDNVACVPSRESGFWGSADIQGSPTNANLAVTPVESARHAADRYGVAVR